MAWTISKFPSGFLSRFRLAPRSLSTAAEARTQKLKRIAEKLERRADELLSLSKILSTAAEARTQKLERRADELLSLSKIERHDYAVLFLHKMGLNRYGPAVSGPAMSGSASAENKAPAAVEKTAFDVKLEKFDAAAKIKVIKELRSFTDLGLKEAKEMVEKAPVVLKKGLTKEEAESIVLKLKEVGATAVLE